MGERSGSVRRAGFDCTPALSLCILQTSRAPLMSKARTKLKAAARADRVPVCSPRALDPALTVQAAQAAVAINPQNAPERQGLGSLLREVAERLTRRIEGLKAAAPGKYEQLPMPQEVLDDDDIMDPQFLGCMTTKYWGAKGVDLTVAFLDNPGDALANRIVEHMMAWSTKAGANVRFRRSTVSPQVRIARASGGYWSYIGTDIKMIPASQQTMNLQGFTMSTPESEFIRVVRHETGHTLGFPHEHTREAIVSQLDAQKTIQYFGRTQGWSPQQVRQQILTPIPESALLDP